MPNNSLLPSALNPTCEELGTSDDGLDDNRPALTKLWSLVADHFAEEHRTLQDQQQLLISRWDSMRDLLVDEENRIQVYAHRLEAKGTEPRPLFRSLTEQASNLEEHRLAKNPSSFPEEQTIASTARTEGQKAQDSSLQKAAEEQDRKLHNLEQANECLRNQLTSLNNKLGAVTKELATARERCASSECCVHLIQDLEDRRARADEVILLVHDRLESLQKRHQKAEKDMSRLKHQGRNKDLTHKQQLSLRKTEYCELERCLDEITDERDKLRGQLNRVLTESATRLTRIRVLESEHSELVSGRRELEKDLYTSHSEHTELQERDRILSSRLAVVKQKLAITTETLDKIRLQANTSPKLRRYVDDLHTLEVTPGKLCNPAHLDFVYLTDCGTLLCVDCGPGVPDFGIDAAFESRATQHFEADRCPWCHADTWTWQRLDVPYSLTAVREMRELWDAIHSSPC